MTLTAAQIYALNPGDIVDLDGEPGARFVRVRGGVATFASADNRRSVRIYKLALPSQPLPPKPPTAPAAGANASPLGPDGSAGLRQEHADGAEEGVHR